MAKPIRVIHYKSFEESKKQVGPHEGVKAAVWLIELLEQQMRDQKLVLPVQWIDFEHEDEIRRFQFSPSGYLEFARRTCEEVVAWTKRAYESQMRDGEDEGGPDIELPPSR